MHRSQVSDRDVRLAHAHDASGLEMIPESVARPTSVEEVAELLREATANRTCVTPAGLQSSTTGASITDTGILLSLRNLSQIGAVNTIDRTIRVGAGAVVAQSVPANTVAAGNPARVIREIE